MILLNKKIYHVVENHVIEIHVKQGTTVKGKHFEINRITNFHSTSSELYFEKSSNMTKTIWQKWVITFFYEILTAHLIYPRVKLTCAGKYVERVKSHS